MSETPTPINTKLVITTDSAELMNTDTQQSPILHQSPEQIQDESISLTPPTPKQRQEEIVEEESKEVNHSLLYFLKIILACRNLLNHQYNVLQFLSHLVKVFRKKRNLL